MSHTAKKVKKSAHYGAGHSCESFIFGAVSTILTGVIAIHMRLIISNTLAHGCTGILSFQLDIRLNQTQTILAINYKSHLL